MLRTWCVYAVRTFLLVQSLHFEINFFSICNLYRIAFELFPQIDATVFQLLDVGNPQLFSKLVVTIFKYIRLIMKNYCSCMSVTVNFNPVYFSLQSTILVHFQQLYSLVDFSFTIFLPPSGFVVFESHHHHTPQTNFDNRFRIL